MKSKASIVIIYATVFTYSFKINPKAAFTMKLSSSNIDSTDKSFFLRIYI